MTPLWGGIPWYTPNAPIPYVGYGVIHDAYTIMVLVVLLLLHHHHHGDPLMTPL